MHGRGNTCLSPWRWPKRKLQPQLCKGYIHPSKQHFFLCWHSVTHVGKDQCVAPKQHPFTPSFLIAIWVCMCACAEEENGLETCLKLNAYHWPPTDRWMVICNKHLDCIEEHQNTARDVTFRLFEATTGYYIKIFPIIIQLDPISFFTSTASPDVWPTGLTHQGIDPRSPFFGEQICDTTVMYSLLTVDANQIKHSSFVWHCSHQVERVKAEPFVHCMEVANLRSNRRTGARGRRNTHSW